MPRPLFNFIANPSMVGSPQDLEALRNLPYERGVSACAHHMWTWPTYRYLRDHTDLNVILSTEYDPGAINITTHRWLNILGVKPHKFFTVSARADWGPCPFVNIEVVQNQAQEGPHAVWIPHWTQQGLIPRDPTRRDITNVGYCGATTELNTINLAQIEQDLMAMGCRLLLKGTGKWHDMHNIDILIAIRSLDRNPHHRKPCTKLRNAWRAGIPCIAGYDSAYAQVGEPGKDYVRVESYQQLLDAVKLLKSSPSLRASLVQAGCEKIKRWSDDEVLRRWVEFLKGSCLERYNQWNVLMSRERLRAIMKRYTFLGVDRLVYPIARPLIPRLKGLIGLTPTGFIR